ncbi:glucoamylase family protein [Paraflavitalea sp. CAU 1676]|uniref:glucoamylase family protein n=1 Tax=Paraflavitalea sp. CAU 1676 TaxID=3032598 RepID=UPI0023DA9C68|nr:glucoamylase family protein [Paraflavitalea sp. CAU 1676]MDF2186827.1 glucoamylase family protein [Paraflavitalea sp. CAU 1676]
MFAAAMPLVMAGCGKSNGGDPAPPAAFNYSSASVNGVSNGSFEYNRLNMLPVIRLSFSAPVNRSTVAAGVSFSDRAGGTLPYRTSYASGDSVLIVQPQAALQGFKQYALALSTALKSTANVALKSTLTFSLNTGIDSSDKFPRISDADLLTKVQQQTFKYFWDFGHPVSGLARERNTSGDIVTSGGSGFGIMALITGIHRNFITRADGLARLQKIVGFLKTKAVTFHGAYPHWLNGASGAVVPFSAKDDGADLVETSYLIQGLLCARQYFSLGDAAELALRNDINAICNKVEWNWFRKNNENVLYWHWSPNNNWDMNLPIRGWDECLITYVLAASSATFGIPKVVYDEGWTRNGAFRNGNLFYGVQLPLGPPAGGPLFFAHYSFLGINPNGLSDVYTNYSDQNKNHSLINYNYCAANPLSQYGYSNQCWGLTASDIPGGYTASSPTNDVGVIAPTAALSSFPYTPAESMQALNFFYYVLGDKLWKEYGFVDAFSLKDPWFADSFLAIDQGPIIVMIENYRSKLLWDLFTGCPEIKTGMKTLGFSAPYL